MKLFIGLVLSLSMTIATQAGLKVRLRVKSENVRIQEILDKEFRSVLGDVLDVTIVNEGQVDEVVLVNGLAVNDRQLAYSTVVLDMDSYLMAARDSVREINLDKLRETLKAREISGTVTYAVLSTCDAVESSVNESVRSTLKGINATSFQSLREALVKFTSPSDSPKIADDERPVIGQ
jgi:hypothetical protein